MFRLMISLTRESKLTYNEKTEYIQNKETKYKVHVVMLFVVGVHHMTWGASHVEGLWPICVQIMY